MTRRLSRVIIGLLVAYWLMIFTLTHLPPVRLPSVEINDKVEHVCAYALLAVLLNIALGLKTSTNRDWMTMVIVLCYGAIDEWLQAPVGRDCDLIDWFADGAGAAIGVALCGLCRFILTRRRVRAAIKDHMPVTVDL